MQRETQPEKVTSKRVGAGVEIVSLTVVGAGDEAQAVVAAVDAGADAVRAKLVSTAPDPTMGWAPGASQAGGHSGPRLYTNTRY